MIKKIGAFVLLAALASCGGSKAPYIQTTKNDKSRNHRTTPKKAVAAKPATQKTEVLESTSRTVVYAEQVQNYVTTYKGIAQDNMRRHGIPASITLAQGILESGAGYGDLCQSANNHFGIKCHKDWTGETVTHDDDAAGECFRKYPKAADSFEDHSQFLTTRSRYASLFELEKDDYEAWAKGLKAAGYATDPKYPDKLIGLIERFQLAQYDAEVLGTAKPAINKDIPVKGELTEVVATQSAPKVVQPTPIVPTETPKQETLPIAKNTEPIVVPAEQPAPTPAVTKASETAAQTPPSGAGGQATDGTHEVVKGDTLYSISKKYNTTVDEIVRLNNLAGNAISIGQVLKVK